MEDIWAIRRATRDVLSQLDPELEVPWVITFDAETVDSADDMEEVRWDYPTQMPILSLFLLLRLGMRRSLDDQEERTEARPERSQSSPGLPKMCAWIAGRNRKLPEHSKQVIESLQATMIADVAAHICDFEVLIEQSWSTCPDHLVQNSKAAVMLAHRDYDHVSEALLAAPQHDQQAFYSLIAQAW